MPEIHLAFVDCKDCREQSTESEKERQVQFSVRAFKALAKGLLYIGFPVIAKSSYGAGADLEGKNCLEEVPKYCPFCGSQNLDFTDTSSEYFG